MFFSFDKRTLKICFADLNDLEDAFSKTGALTIKSSSSSSGGLAAALGESRDGFPRLVAQELVLLVTCNSWLRVVVSRLFAVAHGQQTISSGDEERNIPGIVRPEGSGVSGGTREVHSDPGTSSANHQATYTTTNQFSSPGYASNTNRHPARHQDITQNANGTHQFSLSNKAPSGYSCHFEICETGSQRSFHV